MDRWYHRHTHMAASWRRRAPTMRRLPPQARPAPAHASMSGSEAAELHTSSPGATAGARDPSRFRSTTKLRAPPPPATLSPAQPLSCPRRSRGSICGRCHLFDRLGDVAHAADAVPADDRVTTNRAPAGLGPFLVNFWSARSARQPCFQ